MQNLIAAKKVVNGVVTFAKSGVTGKIEQT
jgi:hypothetical protein